MRSSYIFKFFSAVFLFVSLFSFIWAKDNTIKIGALFAITGPNSLLGAPEDKTARMIVDDINKNGGINGMKVELIVKDTGSKPENAISFAKQLIEEENVVAIIGPSGSGETMAIKDICQKAQTPLLSCAAADSIVNPLARYVFKTPQNTSMVVEWLFKTMKKKGISKIGVVTSNTGFGKDGKANLEKIAPEYGITIVISEEYDKDATDLTALMTKVNAAGVQAVVNWSVEPAQSIVPKNMKQLDMKVPLYLSHGFGNIGYVQAAGEAAEGIVFPCGRLLIANELPNTNPQKKLLIKYSSDYKKLYKEEPSTFGGHAYDALLILKTAIENAKSTDKDKIVDAIEKIKNLSGTAGIFNFSETDHNGLTMDALEMLTVKNGKFTIYKEK